MTQSEFIFICNEATIFPPQALENEKVLKVLRERKGSDALREVLLTEF
mgnify:CR=1 FL=1|tara:strand:+ start:441 stop:584 length:144 start_codon:yes stop_codon:yes gene_type:complete